MDVTVFVQKWGRSQTAKDQEVMRKDLHTDPGTFGFGVVLEAKRLILILDRTLMYTDSFASARLHHRPAALSLFTYIII